MRLNCLLSIIIVCGISLVGCSGLQTYLKEANDLYEKPCYRGEDKPSPYELAGYYESNYPDMNRDEKAIMVYNACKKAGWDVTLNEEDVIVKKRSVSWNSKRVWPVEIRETGTVDSLSDSLKQTADDLDELGDTLQSKKKEDCVSCTKGGACELPADK